MTTGHGITPTPLIQGIQSGEPELPPPYCSKGAVPVPHPVLYDTNDYEIEFWQKPIKKGIVPTEKVNAKVNFFFCYGKLVFNDNFWWLFLS